MIDWSEVIREYGPLVWRTVSRLVRGEADAADCFQATFLSAFQLAQQQMIRHWPAMLVRLATARAIERLRQNLGPARRTEPLLSEPPETRGDPLENASADELSQALRKALTQIDEQQAQVFCLACLDELSYREIARQVGLKESHVGVLLHRAKASLRRALQAFDPRFNLASELSS
jgi:RNA polymerase sigma-70 factor (ECF subfamily)